MCTRVCVTECVCREFIIIASLLQIVQLARGFLGHTTPLRRWRRRRRLIAVRGSAGAAAAALECIAQIGERLRILAAHARRHLAAAVDGI